MDIYKILKFNNSIKSHRIKFVGLWMLSILNKRYLSVQLDPVLACNLRCKMCYFSDPEYVRTNMKGMMREEDIDILAKTFFKNALKLQIGCGAEPTLFKHNVKLIKVAKTHKVPYISMVTNGNLLEQKDVADLAQAGLNEIILSMHGVTKERYEDLMDKGDYEKFHNVLSAVTEQKSLNPNFKLRINYTFNQDNFYELKDFFDVYGKYDIDIIQLRPIDKIGETTYNEFSLKKIESDYSEVAGFMAREAKRRKITLLYPQSIYRDEQISLKVKTANDSSYLIPFTYCYVSPKFAWKDDFNWNVETFAQWQSRTNWNVTLLKNAFASKDKLDSANRNMLNYSVAIN